MNVLDEFSDDINCAERYGASLLDEVDDIEEEFIETKVTNKPIIDHLPNAIGVDNFGCPVLLANPGDKIIIERYASILPSRPWLDTKTYTITNINAGTGVILLWDDDLHRYAGSNFIDGPKRGYRFKLLTNKNMRIGQKKRGRPRKNPTEVPVVATNVALDTNGLPIKKKRGRPPGSKNRPSAEIRVEKIEKRVKLEKKRKNKR